MESADQKQKGLSVTGGDYVEALFVCGQLGNNGESVNTEVKTGLNTEGKSIMSVLHKFISGLYQKSIRENGYGNMVEHYFLENGNRYMFDFDLCQYSHGWRQYDTNQDAWYFGIWVHPESRMIVTYAEGDLYFTTCTEEGYHAELAHMAEVYGPQPPAFRCFDMTTGEETRIYDERPV